MTVEPEGKKRIRVLNPARPGAAVSQAELTLQPGARLAESGEGVPVERVPPKGARRAAVRARVRDHSTAPESNADGSGLAVLTADAASPEAQVGARKPDGLPANPGRPEERPTAMQVAVELLAAGHSDLETLEQLQQGQHITLAQAGAALDAAYRRIAAAHERPGGHRLALALERRQRIAARAYRGEDYRIALAALEQHDKLLGLGDEVNAQSGQAATSLLQLLDRAARGGGYGAGRGAEAATAEDAEGRCD